MNTKDKSLRTAIKLAGHSEDGTPTPEQLTAINGFTLKTLGADEVYVRQFIVAHTGLDRDKEIISDGLLQSISDTLAGKGLFIKHPMSRDGESAPGVGKWFETEVKTVSLEEARTLLGEGVEFSPTATTAKLLFGSAYIPRIDENDGLISKVDAGVAGYVSASFSYESETPIEKDGAVIGYFLSGKGEAREASLVWLGAQQGAQAVKSAKQKTDEDNSVDIKELQTKNKALEGEKITLQTDLDKEKGLRETAETELQSFKDAAGGLTAAEVGKLASERIARKTTLIESIVAFDRNAKKCGDDETAIKAAKDKYAAYPMDALVDLDAANKVTGKGLAGGDPNAGKGGDSELENCPV